MSFQLLSATSEIFMDKLWQLAIANSKRSLKAAENEKKQQRLRENIHGCEIHKWVISFEIYSLIKTRERERSNAVMQGSMTQDPT